MFRISLSFFIISECLQNGSRNAVVCIMLCLDVEEILQNLAHTSLLEELYFWSVKYEFPQKLVTFMLSLLPNDQFKVSIESL